MAPLRYTARFDPILSLDFTPTASALVQSKERKGSNFAIWQHCLHSLNVIMRACRAVAPHSNRCLFVYSQRHQDMKQDFLTIAQQSKAAKCQQLTCRWQHINSGFKFVHGNAFKVHHSVKEKWSCVRDAVRHVQQCLIGISIQWNLNWCWHDSLIFANFGFFWSI